MPELPPVFDLGLGTQIIGGAVVFVIILFWSDKSRKRS